MDQREPGVLVGADGAGGHTARLALRIAPAPGLAEHRGYLALGEEHRRAEAEAAELAWLSGLCRPGGRFELRCTGGTGGPLRVALLARADAPTPAAAVAAARAAICGLPAHVIAEPADVAVELNALTADGSLPATVDLREIRKRIDVRPIARASSPRRQAATAAPLAPSGRSWELLWTELARQPVPTALSVALEPVQLLPEAGLLFHQFAELYARLAAPVDGNPLWQGARRGDPAAEAGRDFFDDAIRRYLGPVYRLRITLAAAGPLPPGLAQLAADQVGGAVLAPEPSERGLAWHNFTTLALDPLPLTHRPPVDQGDWGDVEQELSGLVDRHEAAAAFRLPYEFTGRAVRLFDRPAPAAVPPSAPVAAPTALPPLI
ncbi:hypothetical protein F4556_001853 [Kitasatospora gansuensis]|uniref:Uncharacterized protein n=1 Tax=Kitasatospora gansuensis TaxID=258050 RepID=A0A7W7WGP9_9ACTN|nr:hypothetical protein [Kitasatospora gansuensis]MBB4946318.1 hypothetical protein [Kitasatospora gansuensis]